MSMFSRKKQNKPKKNDSVRKTRQSEAPVADKETARGAQRQKAAALSFGYLIELQKKMGLEALVRLARSPLASLLNSLMIAVAFTLPALLYLLVLNLQVLGGNWDGQPKVSVYLNPELRQTRIDQLVEDAKKDSNIESVIYISPKQGLEDFQEKSAIGNIAAELGFNPLPGVLVLTPPVDASFEQLERIVKTYENQNGVSQVQMDRQWVQRLNAILELLERVVTTLGILLALTVLLVISNTIRLNIESRRDEIRIIKMVGGTDGFITLPFLYMGAWYGVAGALVAQLLIVVVVSAVSDQIMSLAGLYNSGLAIQGAGFGMFMTLLAIGIILGIIGAAVSCYRHLRTLVPK